MDRREFLRRAALGVGALSLSIGASRRGAEAITKPNIVLIITDDQPRRRTWRREILPRIFGRMVDGGLDYERGYCATPFCTQTRWSMISGLWAHNHRALQNVGYMEGKSKGLLNDTPWTRLASLGYRNGYFGKLQNGYNESRLDLPPGLDKSAICIWIGPFEKKPYYFNEYGVKRGFSSDDSYVSNIITQRAETFINQQATRPEPFFMTVSYLSPHDPYTPEPEYASFYENELLETVPSMAGLTDAQKAEALKDQKGIMREMQDVDEGVDRLFARLEATGQMANTYIFYITDNGNLIGEHGWFFKDSPYEEALHIPFAAVGPGIPAGVKSLALASHIDIFPTICDLAGASWSDKDGRSMVPTLDGSTPAGWRSRVFCESLSSNFTVLRDDAYAYFDEWGAGAKSLYDMTEADADPADTYQMQNLIGTPEGQAVQATYQQKVNAFKVCRGASCRAVEE